MRIIQIADFQTFGSDCINIAKEASEYADIIWFRIKTDDVEAEAKAMREALPDVFLCLSLNADIASKYGYQAVQLGADSDVEAVRHKYPELKIGYSAHSIDEIKDKQADYYTLSPIFHTEKEYEVNPLGVIDVKAFDKEIYALGGINRENVSQLIRHGYAGVAGISFYKELKEISALLNS